MCRRLWYGVCGRVSEMEKKLTCIGCPLGCSLTVTMDGMGEGVAAVSGNTCPKGEAYARKEMTNPTRIVTSAVRVENGCAPMVSCKTKADIPKGRIFDVTAALAGLRVAAPVHIGDVILPDAAGTGVDIVATKNVEAAV